MIALSSVSVRLGGRVVVDDVSLTVGSGEWVTIVGPNGAGKSTLVRFIAGIVAGTGGLLLEGRDARALSSRERARAVALVPQTPNVPAGITVLEYVLLGRTPHISWFGAESRADVRAALEALGELGLDGHDDRPLSTLSGGQRQGVFLARALAQQAPVVLLDEPTTALDVGHQQQALELVDRLRRERGLTVVSTMHDLTLAGLYADRLVLLNGGRIAASGAAAEVLTEANLAHHYGARVEVLELGGRVVVLPVRESVR